MMDALTQLVDTFDPLQTAILIAIFLFAAIPIAFFAMW